MTLARDLLDQADLLARLGPKNPKQANLRRAVSAAYYALFHLLVEEAARVLSGLIGKADIETIGRVTRTFTHEAMKRVAESFGRSELPSVLRRDGVDYRIPDDLRTVAKVFTDLQQARHEADYNIGRPVTRADAHKLIQEARRAFEAWQRVHETDDARMYLACFSLWDTWNKKR